MRDPARIELMLDLVRRYWQQYPDLRLAQLIVAMVRPTESCPEVFYHEDDRLLKSLREAVERVERKPE